MKRFKWRLQRLLDIKDKTEQVKRAELLQISEQLVEAHALVRTQQRLLQQTLKRVGDMSPAERVHEQPMVLRQASYNEQHIKRLQGTIEKLEEQKEAKKQEVLTLRREREGLERLREQALADYIVEQEQQDQKEVDDRVNMSYARQRQTTPVEASVAVQELASQGDSQ